MNHPCAIYSRLSAGYEPLRVFRQQGLKSSSWCEKVFSRALRRKTRAGSWENLSFRPTIRTRSVERVCALAHVHFLHSDPLSDVNSLFRSGCFFFSTHRLRRSRGRFGLHLLRRRLLQRHGDHRRTGTWVMHSLHSLTCHCTCSQRRCTAATASLSLARACSVRLSISPPPPRQLRGLDTRHATQRKRSIADPCVTRTHTASRSLVYSSDGKS